MKYADPTLNNNNEDVHESENKKHKDKERLLRNLHFKGLQNRGCKLHLKKTQVLQD